MCAVERKLVPEECSTSGGVNESVQKNGKRSFTITVDDKGMVEVSPSGQFQQESHPQQQTRKVARKMRQDGKPRIRIALVEEASGSSDGELDNVDDKCDMVSIDAQSLETMHDRFVKIYNKKLRGKPSFVVLEDALVRKRVEETLQSPCGRNICHMHAEQQTSPCDIGANTGSQTDEFLLQCAMRSKVLKAQSRGCQAGEMQCNCNVCNCNLKKSRPLQRLSQLCATQLANKLKQHISNQPTAAAATAAAAAAATATCNPAAAAARAKPDYAPHVTISFIPLTNTVNPQQQPLSAATVVHTNSCCQQMPTATNAHCCQQTTDGSYGSFLNQQQQLQLQQQQQQYNFAQQQHPAAGCTCSSCCMLRPAMAQTTLGFGQATGMPSQCGHPMLLTPDSCPLQQRLQPQEYPLTGWPPQVYNHCLCYSMPAASMSAFDIPHCATCHMQQPACCMRYNDLYQQQQQPQQQQQQQQLQQQPPQQCVRSHSLSKLPNTPEVKSMSEIQVPCEESDRNLKAQEPVLQSQDKVQKVDLTSSVSQETVKRISSTSPNVKKLVMEHARNTAGGSCQGPKLFMARFGRTCLILKPTTSNMPSRLLGKRISRYTSVMACPQKMAKKEA